MINSIQFCLELDWLDLHAFVNSFEDLDELI